MKTATTSREGRQHGNGRRRTTEGRARDLIRKARGGAVGCLLALGGFAAGCGDEEAPGTGPEEEPTLDPTSLSASADDGQPGFPTEVVVEARDTERRPFLGALPGLQLEVRGANPASVTGAVNNDDGTYTLAYLPAEAGFDTLVVALDGAPVEGSPIASRVRVVWEAATGTATADGVVGSGEWDAAPEYPVFDGPELTGSTVRFMADETNLHILFTFPDSVPSAGVRFDNTLDFRLDGDDLIAAGTLGASDLVFDPPSYRLDFVAHVEGAANATSSATVIELSHPLKSGDAEDISLDPTFRVGVCLIAGTVSGGLVAHSTEPDLCSLVAYQQVRYAELRRR